MTKKQLIIDFLTKNPVEKFLKMSEPNAIAFERFSKIHPDISFGYFTKVFNEIEKIMSLMPVKLTTKNLSYVIDNFPRKYEHGFVRAEIGLILKKYKISNSAFNKEMGINTAMIINGETVNYDNDIEKTIQCILQGRTKNSFEWD